MACRRAGFELIWPDALLSMSVTRGDDLARAQVSLEEYVERHLTEDRIDLVVSPSPHDRHPAHELVGRAARTVLARRPGAVWWLWGLWADLPLPNILVPFGAERMRRVLYALEAHEGELERSDYRRLVSGRAEANRMLGVERVFGWGAGRRDVAGVGPETPYAEVVCEVIRAGEMWRLGAPRVLRPDHPFAEPTSLDVSFWIDRRSVTEELGS